MKNKLDMLLMLVISAMVVFSAHHLYKRSQPQEPSAPVYKLETLQKSVVRLLDKDGQFFCSGTVVKRNVVLTAAHCLSWMNSTETIMVQTSDGRILDRKAKTLAFNERADIGLVVGTFDFMPMVEIETDSAKVISAFKRNNLQLCGYPWGGNMLCNNFDFVAPGLITMDGHAFAWPGMSGGPVFDMTTGKIVANLQGINAENLIIVNPTTEINDMLQASVGL